MGAIVDVRRRLNIRWASAISVVVLTGGAGWGLGCAAGADDSGVMPDAATRGPFDAGVGGDAAASEVADGGPSKSPGDATLDVAPGDGGGAGFDVVSRGGGDGSVLHSGDASPDVDAAAADDGGRHDSGASVPATLFARYEAESAANTLTYPVEGVVTEGDVACPGVPGTSTDGVREGANCASAGHVINQILGRSPCTPPTSTTSYTNCGNDGGGITFHSVTVPADGIYDVTFWYHSGQLTPGQADVFGDIHCGGLDYNTGPGSGCRPHVLYVNGVEMSTVVGGQSAVYYEFPAYPDSWSIVHGAVVALPLNAGDNTIYIKAPGFQTSDAADIDALDVQPSGPGAPKFQAKGTGGPPTLPIGLVTPVVNWN
jgi:hypothetical protein